MKNKEKLEAFIEEAKTTAAKYGLSMIVSAYTIDKRGYLQTGSDYMFEPDVEEDIYAVISGSITTLVGTFMKESMGNSVPDDVALSAALSELLNSYTDMVVPLSLGEYKHMQRRNSQNEEDPYDTDKFADDFLEMLNNYKNRKQEEK